MVAKKHFGYQRSRALTKAGQTLHLWKAVLSSKRNGRKMGEHHKKQAKKIQLQISDISGLTKRQAQLKVPKARRQLWEVQKNATAKRIEWLESNAQDIARAAGEIDWEKKMKQMARIARERGVNRKMNSAVKGPRSGLDRIEIPMDNISGSIQKQPRKYINTTKECLRHTLPTQLNQACNQHILLNSTPTIILKCPQMT